MSRPVLYLVAFGIFVAIAMAGTAWALHRSAREVARHHEALAEEEAEYGDDTDPGTDRDGSPSSDR